VKGDSEVQVNKQTIIINGIRAKNFKVKCFIYYEVLNDLMVLYSRWRDDEPKTSPRIIITSRHMKFKYPINRTIVKQLLTNDYGRIYKMYTLKNMAFPQRQSIIPKLTQ